MTREVTPSRTAQTAGLHEKNKKATNSQAEIAHTNGTCDEGMGESTCPRCLLEPELLHFRFVEGIEFGSF